MSEPQILSTMVMMIISLQLLLAVLTGNAASKVKVINQSNIDNYTVFAFLIDSGGASDKSYSTNHPKLVSR